MADVTLKYKNNVIAELNDTSNKILKTSGKYCEADISVEYVKSSVSKPEQEKSVNPTTIKQTVLPDDGYVLSKVEVEAIPTETKTISNVDFSTGNMTVTPTEGKYMTSVDITKPSTLIAENVKKDVNIAGIVGTLESGGGSSVEINDGNYLFYGGARTNIRPQLLSMCKNLTAMFGMFRSQFDNDFQNVDLNMLDTSNVYTMEECFYGCNMLNTLDIHTWNTSKATNMKKMFAMAGFLHTLDIGDWDVSKVTDFSYMFQMCYRLKNLNISAWNTSSAKNMYSMFTEFNKVDEDVTFPDTSSFDTSNVTNMSYMFANSFLSSTSDLTYDISNFNTNNVTNNSYMFYGCTKLKKIIINRQDVFKMTATNMLQNCPADIYVPDNMVDTYKSATNWSAFADRIKGMSELEA